jgi:FkbM family methyltransferase
MIRQNAFSNVTVVRAAAGAREASASLHLDPNNKGQHSLVAFEGEVSSEQVRVVTVDSVIEKNGARPVHLVKIDIEGWEAQALEGMSHILDEDRPTILFEFMPAWIRRAGDSPEELLSLLVRKGYRLSALDEDDGESKIISDFVAFMQGFKKENDYVNVLAVHTLQ